MNNVESIKRKMRKIVNQEVPHVIFEPCNSVTQRKFSNLLRKQLNILKLNKEIVDFKVMCNKKTNPEPLTDNCLRGTIWVKPSKSNKIIEQKFSIT
jgi:hypothetical protein